MNLKRRTPRELAAAPKPQNVAELEILSEWYFGMPLHLSSLRVYGGGASYAVREDYNAYHGDGWLWSEYSCDGYDYSGRFWQHVIGPLYCGGIARNSYGQAHIDGHRSGRRLQRLANSIRENGSGRPRAAFVRLAREYGAGESAVTRDSCTHTDGRVDGASGAFELQGGQS